MMTTVMAVMMQMNIIVVTILCVHSVRSQLRIAVRITAAATVRAGRIWTHLIIVRVIVVVVV